MKVSEIMNTEVHTILPDTPMKIVNRTMQKYNLGYLFIVNEKKEIQGVITYTDLFRLVLPSYQKVMEEGLLWLSPEVIESQAQNLMDRPVKEFMEKDVLKIHPNEMVFKAGAEMIAHSVKQIPVVENNKLVGVISFHDILWELLMINR
ncbi:cyclic nucleotide-binding/CBS domain-containing protein [Melioribacteraceae bacterium 4301-Me]|uniref:CBS domain-containing protein n=1 Tax=Pyranulibacter aquaticus TaxID=3163344 RepID=UPI003599CC5B